MMAPNGGGWGKVLLRSYPWGRDNQRKLSMARSFYTQRIVAAMHANGRGVRSGAIATTHARTMHNQHRCTYYTSSDGKKYNKKFWNSLGIVIIPQQTAYIVERLGKYKKTLLA
ncbi:stomatin-like protein, partial [Plasmodium cynomolgi strain B]